MNTKLTLALFMFFGILTIGCKQKEQNIEPEGVRIDLINDEFPEAKEEIMLLMEELKETIIQGDIDKLISGHGYGPKFTEFQNGERRNGGKKNEEIERGFFGNVTEVLKIEFDDLKIAAYDDVANVTFHSDLLVKLGENQVSIKEQVTLLYVKTENGWKCVHEHHSSLKNKES